MAKPTTEKPKGKPRPDEPPLPEFPPKGPRAAPGGPQPPEAPTTPDYQRANEKLKKAVEKEDEFLQEEVLGEGFEGELEPQNVQSNIEDSLEEPPPST